MSVGGVDPTGVRTGFGPGGEFEARHFAVTGDDLRRAWGWLLFLGVVLIILGTLALIAPYVATQFVVMVYGWVLLFAGVAQVVVAFASARWGGFFLHLLMGIIDVVLGLLFLLHPLPVAVALTLFLAAGFLVGGVFRLVAAFSLRFPGWGWTALSGVITLAVGVLLWAWWPWDWTVVGLFVGIQMVFYGWSAVMLALAARSHMGAGAWNAPAPPAAAGPA
jgi:uncharacterized membrane protein HdeD (DUF308 family)